jgi:hypothetical protein
MFPQKPFRFGLPFSKGLGVGQKYWISHIFLPLTLPSPAASSIEGERGF